MRGQRDNIPLTERLFSAIPARFTRGVNTESHNTQQTINKSLLNFGTNNSVPRTTNLRCIDLFRLTNAANEEVMSGHFLRCKGCSFAY